MQRWCPDELMELTESNNCFKQLFMSTRAVPRIATPTPVAAPVHDKRTRDKLIEAAGHVFADRGYRAATVREICRRAGANVASVNYTFGDKMGLYTEVLRESLRAGQLAALGKDLQPEEVLRGVIRARLESLHCADRPDWHFRMAMHEMLQPTPAMARVIDEGVRPVQDRMRQAVAELTGLPPDHETTRLCINSIVGQFLFYTFARPVLERLQPDLKLTPEMLDRIAEHIYEFSMAYLRKVRARQHAKAAGTKERQPR